MTAGHLGAGLHAAGLSAAISSAAAAGLVGENLKSPIDRPISFSMTGLKVVN